MRFVRIIIVIINSTFLGQLWAGTEYYVLSSETKEGLFGVSIVFFREGQSVGLIRTDEKGAFVIADNLNYDQIEVRKLGYEKLVFRAGMIPDNIYITPSPTMIEEIVVTGLVMPGNKYQSPFKLKYYTREEIENKKVNNLAEFLMTENNFTVNQDPILGTRISLNGQSEQDVNLLIDGVPVAGRLNGGIDYSQIMLSNIERIETVDGPLSVIYGANSSGGVINLITKTKIKDNNQVNGNLYTESVGIFNVNGSFTSKYEGNTVTFGFGRNAFLGWDPNEKELRQTIKPVWRDYGWNPKEQIFSNLSFYRKFNSKHTLHIKLNGFWEEILDKKNPTSQYTSTVFDHNYNTQRFTLGGTHNFKFHKDFELTTNGNGTIFNRYVKNYSQDLRLSQRRFLDESLETQYNFFVRSTLRHDALSSSMKGLYGLDIKWDAINTPKLRQNAKNIFELGLFSMFNINLTEKLFLQPGLRLAFNSNLLTPLSPTINLRYEPLRYLSTRISYSRGYRNPEIKELYFEFIDNNHNIKGNPNLKTETNDNIQLGFDIKPDLKDKDNYSYSTSFTASYISKQDAIEIIPSNTLTNEFIYFNVGGSKSIVASLDNRIKYHDYLFSLGINVIGNQKRFKGLNNQVDDFLFNISTNLNVTYKYKPLDLKISCLNKFQSPINFTVLDIKNNQAQVSRISSYLMSDLNVSRPFFSGMIDLTIGVKNIWNVKNLSVSGFNPNVHSNNLDAQNFLWGRTVFTSISLKLNE